MSEPVASRMFSRIVDLKCFMFKYDPNSHGNEKGCEDEFRGDSTAP